MTALDWAVIVGYALIVLALGTWFSRKQRSTSDFFMAGRRMPMPAVAISVLATSVSAVTFIGGPQAAYTGDLTYLSANIGGIIAIVIVALVFIPAYYRLGVTTVYELLGHRFGGNARRFASAMFMVGRLFASGARLFAASIPVSFIMFGVERGTDPASLTFAILLVAAVGMAYTTAGGIAAIIWTDVLQTVVLVGSVLVAGVVMLNQIPLETGDIFRVLADAPGPNGEGSKLRVFDLSLHPSHPYSLAAILIGMTLFNMAAFGTDQDLAQRMLTCRSAARAGWAAVLANLMGVVVVGIFLALGLLLYVLHIQESGGDEGDSLEHDGMRVFLAFILNEMPTGLRGLMIAGLLAAAMSSLDSALNALSSTAVCDFYTPLVPGRSERHYLRVSRISVVVWAVLLAGFAIASVGLYRASGEHLIDFALGVMVFAYAGLLGVFLTAICTKRGNTLSVALALVVGFVTVGVLYAHTLLWKTHGFVWEKLPGSTLASNIPAFAFAWRMAIGTAVSFAVCAAGRSAPSVDSSERMRA